MKKRVSPEQRNAQFEPTYFFGYGSLMLPGGINGRNMSKTYRQKDLIPCRLKGYSRSMCAYFGGRNFYGLLEDKKKTVCNGVVFKVHDWYDYRALLASEGATSRFKNVRTYWPIRVTDRIFGFKIPEGHRVMTLLCKTDKSRLGRVERSYIRLCHVAAERWGKDFEQEFLNTGGVPYTRKGLAEVAKKMGIKVW